MALMESQSTAIISSRAIHVIREGSVKPMKVDYPVLSGALNSGHEFKHAKASLLY
jgi:hypothetical protein